MSIKRGKLCKIESFRSSVNEQVTSVGEEILRGLEKQLKCDDDASGLKKLVRRLVGERLAAAVDFICGLFQREVEEYESVLDHQSKLLDMVFNPPHNKLHATEICPEQQERTPSLVQEEPMPPRIKDKQDKLLQRPEAAAGSTLTLLDGATLPIEKWGDTLSDFLPLPVCKQVSPERLERRPSLVKEEPKPLQIKEKQVELLQRPEVADASIMTIAVKSEDDGENGKTEPLASTSTEHMKTQADVEDYGTSQSTNDDQFLSSPGSEYDNDDSDEWENTGLEGYRASQPASDSESDNEQSDDLDQTREAQSALNTLESLKTQSVEGQTSSSSNKLSQDLKSAKQSTSMKRKRKTAEKSFSCTVCGKVFNRSGNLKIHMRTHTGEKPFNCAVCGTGFNHSGNLKIHMRVHTGEKPFSCTVCGKACGNKGDLTRHMRIHTGEKPFSCTLCNKSFKQSGQLKIHMRVHTGEKPFTCAVCGKGCGDKGDLIRHMRIHTGEKPFTCTVCGKSFNRNITLKTHLIIHTGEKNFSCTICNKSFGGNRELKRHMMTHTGEKPYTCATCKKSFNQSGSLKKHMRIHTGEKPFSCTICDKRFIQNEHLKIHIRSHTEDKTRVAELSVDTTPAKEEKAFTN